MRQQGDQDKVGGRHPCLLGSTEVPHAWDESASREYDKRQDGGGKQKSLISEDQIKSYPRRFVKCELRPLQQM